MAAARHASRRALLETMVAVVGTACVQAPLVCRHCLLQVSLLAAVSLVLRVIEVKLDGHAACGSMLCYARAELQADPIALVARWTRWVHQRRRRRCGRRRSRVRGRGAAGCGHVWRRLARRVCQWRRLAHARRPPRDALSFVRQPWPRARLTVVWWRAGSPRSSRQRSRRRTWRCSTSRPRTTCREDPRRTSKSSSYQRALPESVRWTDTDW